MTETAIIITMKFYETNFIIIYPNPEDTAKIAGGMD